MKTNIIPSLNPVLGIDNKRWSHTLARKQVYKFLQRLQGGQLLVEEAGEVNSFGHCEDAAHPIIVVNINDSRFWLDIAMNGGLGAGESYIQGRWSCNNLVALLRLMLRNLPMSDGMDRINIAWQAAQQAWHRMRRNTLTGSRDNIRAHYDLSNSLFSLFLDARMMYSSAYYPTPDMSLEQASEAKLRLVCQKLQLGPQDHLLEIGTGWGGLAIYAAQHFGCRVTTTTISEQQYQYAKQAIKAAGLSKQINLLRKDYRELQGQYDKLVSIEMVEAVGHEFLSTYFKQCDQLLKPAGRMLLQAITIRDDRYQQALQRVDFIKRHIFPGGFLPSLAIIKQTLQQTTSMQPTHEENIARHYARTLADWKQRFDGQYQNVLQLGYPEAFVRMWRYYLDYCQAGFLEAHLGTWQLVLDKQKS
ncbi:MAG: cyclopropane-fatty-acyl-phospholipid synthase family protein [Gammaproteobacteria bacterium]|jgi:cyclopropane-fatty-acyl-phospholipid synthase|nr:cyclopropane-fatty-acyl-phospholipid synthase family protein [Gammaproteobacteria bacterium]